MDRQQWLAVRDSGSLGQCLRSRERFVHVSKQLVVVTGADGRPQIKVSDLPGRTFQPGRNFDKRILRAGLPRKRWPTLPRAA